VDFLSEEGLAERRGQRVIFARNLLRTLRQRELAAAARGVARETSLPYLPLVDGNPTSGFYRRSLLLVSGRFAVLESAQGFVLAPWVSAIEPFVGQALRVTTRGGKVSWNLGRLRGPSIE